MSEFTDKLRKICEEESVKMVQEYLYNPTKEDELMIRNVFLRGVLRGMDILQDSKNEVA